MTPQVRSLLRFTRHALGSALVWTAIAALLWWDDSHRDPRVHEAFIGFIISAISLIASWLGAAGGAIAAATVAMVQWLSGTVAWLGLRIRNLIGSTGAMFSKVWSSAKGFWFDVARPAFAHVVKWAEDARTWLKEKLGPTFRLIGKIRQRVTDIYTKWVRPILDTIETTRSVLKVLETLHVPFARQLDRYLEQAESLITENYLKLSSWITRVQDVLNSIVTGDLLFQRIPFLASLRRDTPQWVRMFWNAQVRGMTAGDRARLAARKVGANDPAELRAGLADFVSTGDGALAPKITELAVSWKVAAGFRPAIATTE